MRKSKVSINLDGEYALYKEGEKLVEGTVDEISKATGKTKEELFHYQTPAYRYGNHRYKMLRIG